MDRLETLWKNKDGSPLTNVAEINRRLEELQTKEWQYRGVTKKFGKVNCMVDNGEWQDCYVTMVEKRDPDAPKKPKFNEWALWVLTEDPYTKKEVPQMFRIGDSASDLKISQTVIDKNVKDVAQ